MSSLQNAFLSFSSQVMGGDEGVFFSVKGKGGDDGWVFGVGDQAQDVSFDEDVFPVFSCFDYKGEQSLHKGFTDVFDSEELFGVALSLSSEKKASIEKHLSQMWIKEDRMLEDCSNETLETFPQSIHKAQQAQRDGEMWVCNLTHEPAGKVEDPLVVLAAFWRFLQTDKSHIGGVWVTNEQMFCSFSPELFLHLDGEILRTCPVKGTGDKEVLERSEKEISELLMVTDLLRNDLGMISEKVWVESEREVVPQRDFYQAQVDIRSRLDKEGLTEDRLQQLLPAGSISGCPKKRVCAYIDELESFERGFYTGIFGVRLTKTTAWYNILIRTLFIEQDRWRFPVGAGITHLSDPEAEWKETLLKAGSLEEFCIKKRYFEDLSNSSR